MTAITRTTPRASEPGDTAEANTGFFINAGTHSGWFTSPDGDIYDIRKLEPREVTDPRSGEVTTIWGGYATARDREVAAKDAIMQAQFKKQRMGKRVRGSKGGRTGGRDRGWVRG